METHVRDGLADEDRGADEEVRRRRPAPAYAFERVLEPGETMEVAPGVLMLRLPLPFDLNHINVWLLRDGDGWTVVDTGLTGEKTMSVWRSLFDTVMEGLPVKRVIVTHMHPDHVGLAGWLTRRFDCRLWMTRLEYLSCSMLVSHTGREAPEEGVRFYRAAGWSEPELERYRVTFGGFGKGIYAMPNAFHRIHDGDRFLIDGREWIVVGGNGHSPEHACLFRPDDRIMISGDQVLPRISSNVSVWPTEPDADPLTDWLDSLEKLGRELPADTLVLPAHGEPFRGLHDRLATLTRGHDVSLERLMRSLRDPKRAVDVFGALFARPIGENVYSMATGESLAHLNCLRTRGQASVELDAEGVAWWRATTTEAAA
jgi:glyoxylase-like metal-dependent hydrolase (beta-lactamase superfamily II)